MAEAKSCEAVACRGRSPAGDPERVKSSRLESASASTAAVIDSLAAANSGVVSALRRNLEKALGSQRAWENRSQELQALLVSSNEKRARAELKRIEAQSGLEYQSAAMEALSERLGSGTSSAVSAVTRRLTACTSAALKALESRAAGETAINEQLVSLLQSFVNESLALMHQKSEAELTANLSSAEKDVAIARLQSSLSFELARHTRYSREVDTLMRIVASLAQRSQQVDTSRGELARAKAHVRLLESYLDLNAIVAAVAPPETIPQRRPRPPAPSRDLLKRTPHFFAMRMIEHKDITLSELVEAWLGQEKRIVESENNLAALKCSVDAVRRDALLVHQKYLEEKQRREVSDRRITEMVRERLRGSSDAAVVEELQQVRWNYAQVADDAAQLAVSLKLAREELESAAQNRSELEQRLAQMQRDVQANNIAATLAELRSRYEETMERLRVDYVEAESQRRILSEALQRQQPQLEEALRTVQSCLDNEAQMKALLESSETRSSEHSSWQRTGQQAEGVAHAVHALQQHVSAMGSAVHSMRTQSKALQADVTKSSMRFHEQIRDFVLAVGEGSSRVLEQTAEMWDGRSRSDGTDRAEDTVRATATTEAMRDVLNGAMKFVCSQMESADSQQTSLLDASISDAQCVSFALQKLRDVTEQRDALQDRLSRCEKIIDDNQLTLVERALMHEVSVEDSLSAEEASDRITSLQEQLATQGAVRQSAIEEIRALQEQQKVLESEVERLTRENGRLTQRCEQAVEAVAHSESAQRSLLATKTSLQERVDTLLQQLQQSEETDPEAAAAAVEAADSQLKTALTSFGEKLVMMTNVIESATAQRLTPSAGVSGAVGAASNGPEDDSAEGVTSEREVGQFLARSGLNGVVALLSSTLRKAHLLHNALEASANASTLSLAKAATSGDPALTTPEMLLAVERDKSAKLERAVERLETERAAMEQKLAETDATVSKTADMNVRLLGLTNKLREMQERSTLEIRSLKLRLSEALESRRPQTEEGSNDAVAVTTDPQPPTPPVPMESVPEEKESMAPPSLPSAVPPEPTVLPPVAPSNIAEEPIAGQDNEEMPEIDAAPSSPPADGTGPAAETEANEEADKQ